MKEEDFIAPNDRLHDDYVTSRPMKEWHNIDSYVTKLLENNPGLSEYDCFAVCCRSLSSLSKQVSDWPNSVSKYASTLLSKWKGPEKQHWLLSSQKKPFSVNVTMRRFHLTTPKFNRKKLSNINEP